MNDTEKSSCSNLYAYFSKLCFGGVAKEQSVLSWHPFLMMLSHKYNVASRTECCVTWNSFWESFCRDNQDKYQVSSFALLHELHQLIQTEPKSEWCIFVLIFSYLYPAPLWCIHGCMFVLIFKDWKNWYLISKGHILSMLSVHERKGFLLLQFFPLLF